MNRLLLLAAMLAPTVAAAQPGYGYGGGGGEPEPPFLWHNGLTFEGNIGLGVMVDRTDTVGGPADGRSSSDQHGAVGLGGSIGGFLNPQLALGFRLSSVNYSVPAYDGYGGTWTRSAIFLGVGVQYWVNEAFWLGGGLGYVVDHLSYQDDYGTQGDSYDDPTGIGVSLRAGYTFFKHFRNSWYFGAEYTPGFMGEVDYGPAGKQQTQLNGFALSIGYQYL